MKPCFRPLLVALVAAGMNGGCGSGPTAHDDVARVSCDDHAGAVFALTDGPTTDEDGTFLYRFVCDFDFPAVRAASAFAPQGS